MDLEKLATAIRQKRLALNLTQEALAGLADISTSQLRLLERGSGNPTISTLTRVHEALGLPFPALLLSASQSQEELPVVTDPEYQRLQSMLQQLPPVRRKPILRHICSLTSEFVQLETKK